MCAHRHVFIRRRIMMSANVRMEDGKLVQFCNLHRSLQLQHMN